MATNHRCLLQRGLREHTHGEHSTPPWGSPCRSHLSRSSNYAWKSLCGWTLQRPGAPLDESDADSGVTGAREPSPVPVGAADPLELSEEESTEGDEAAADPTYIVPQGHGRFAIRYSRLGNFEKGNARTESTVVAGWLTSGLEIAMHRMGWNLLSTHKIEQRGTLPSLSPWLPSLP